MISELHIKVSDIPEEGLFLNFEELSGHIPEIDDYSTISSARGRLEVRRSGSEVRISGHVLGILHLSCDRCLNRFPFQVNTPFFYLLKPPGDFHSDLDPDHEVSGDEIEVYWYEDGEIRVEDLFREQILLQVPMRILCKKDCMGLCPGCGADLNKERCQCKEITGHGPFSVLANLKESLSSSQGK